MPPCGTCYLDGDDEAEDYHLHVVASNTDRSGLVAVVSISTVRSRFSDKTVILKPGDHPFIKQESYVAYGFARLQAVTEIDDRLRKQPKKVKEACTPELLGRIQAGVLESERTENGVKHFMRELHPGT